MAIKWNSNTVAAEIGTTIIAKMVAGYPRTYQIFPVTTGAQQVEIMNNVNIDQWADIQSVLDNKNPTTGKLLSGFKEGLDNDWAPTVNGYIQLEQDIQMLRQQINARIQTLPNEVDGFDGIDYMNVIFGGTSVEQKAAALAEVIQNIPTVKSVTFINAVWVDKEKGVFKFTFHIQSVFGDLEFQMGLDAQNRTIFNP